MRITRRVLAALVAVAALAALGASTAGASGFSVSGLELTEGGKPLAAGAPIYNDQLIVGHCLVESNGNVVNNGAPVDLLTIGQPTITNCEEGNTATGGIRLTALGSNGQALLYTQLSLTVSGCKYNFPLMQGSFPIGNGSVAYITGKATGLRDWRSPGTCAPRYEPEFAVSEVGPGDDAPLGTELVQSHWF
jgi:hypothetical protein